MIHGKWGVHTLCMHNNTKMGDHIDIIHVFTRIAHRTQRNPHIYICVRIDDVNTCPLLVEPIRHRWFPLTKGQWCGGFDIRIVVSVKNYWTTIRVAGGLRHYRSLSTSRLSFSFELVRWFIHSLSRRSFTHTMVHACTLSVSRRTDRRTAKLKPITNLPPPPSQVENGIAIATNVILC